MEIYKEILLYKCIVFKLESQLKMYKAEIGSFDVKRHEEIAAVLRDLD